LCQGVFLSNHKGAKVHRMITMHARRKQTDGQTDEHLCVGRAPKMQVQILLLLNSGVGHYLVRNCSIKTIAFCHSLSLTFPPCCLSFILWSSLTCDLFFRYACCLAVRFVVAAVADRSVLHARRRQPWCLSVFRRRGSFNRRGVQRCVPSAGSLMYLLFAQLHAAAAW